MTRVCLRGGRIYDPAQGLSGEIGNVFIEDGRIAADPGPAARDCRSYDLTGQIVMPGAIDIHTHVAGGNVNSARLLLPEQHRASMEQRFSAPFAAAKWSSWETGYRYARMGYTTVVEPAVLPVNSLQAHLEMLDIPIVDKAGLAILGNDDLLLGLLRDGRPQAEVNDYVAWTLEATQCLGIKVINAGGANAFKSNLRKLDLDDSVPEYGVSSRRILQALQNAVCDLGLPHPLHVHCNNLGVAGNVETALATVAAAEGRPLHLAHIQFYGYGKEGKRGFSSGGARIAEAIDSNPHITADIGQVLFGQTVTVSGDSMRQYDARTIARPRKWVSWDAECQGGGGIVPYRYSPKSFVNTLQWAIGLEIFLLARDPGRVFFTTDHPNGAPFTRYPELFALLMDKDYRASWFERVNRQALDMTLLPQMDREFSMDEIALMTRTAPAKLLGLNDRGHLRPGAVADVAVYTPQTDIEKMFSAASLVFKDGELVVRNGDIVATPKGKTHTAHPRYDPSVEHTVKAHYDSYYSLKPENFKVTEQVFASNHETALVKHSVG